MAAKKDTLINMFVALFVICVVSGGVLGVVYNATKEPIAAAETQHLHMQSPCIFWAVFRKLGKVRRNPR